MKTPIRFAPNEMSQSVICRPREGFEETSRAAGSKSLRLAMERFHQGIHPALPQELKAQSR
jgi:hypothetical protein